MLNRTLESILILCLKLKGVYGSFLLACYDSSNDEYQSICKLDLEERSASIDPKKLISKPEYYRCDDSAKSAPDVWFEPTEVAEMYYSQKAHNPNDHYK
ncbi:DNA ligase 1-like [Quercus suber]|uniref:DNA ligase 1-like n=1 Tax=Quercus suber TaxID=58331 RepID=UPI0032E014C0